MLQTCYYESFAGRRRKFELNLGGVSELERLCGVGIGGIMVRLATHQFGISDVRETIRLGLEGGGAAEAEATALVMRYVDGKPVAEYLPLASMIVKACIDGIPQENKKKEERAENHATPETSPGSTERAE